MRGLLLTDTKTGSDIVIPPPEVLPQFAIGTTVIAKVMDDNDQYMTIEGDIIGIEVTQEMDLKEMVVNTNIGYRVNRDRSNEVHFVDESEIIEYYPDTNEHDVAYHMRDEE